jgi:hypothetical protein
MRIDSSQPIQPPTACAVREETALLSLMRLSTQALEERCVLRKIGSGDNRFQSDQQLHNVVRAAKDQAGAGNCDHSGQAVFVCQQASIFQLPASTMALPIELSLIHDITTASPVSSRQR